jgi:hypothetical protein
MLDADDYWLPDKLVHCANVFRDYGHKHVGIVYHDVLIHNETTGTTVHEFRRPFDRMVLEQECIICNTPLVSREALVECGLYDEGMRTAEDWELWLRITDKFTAIHVPKPLSVYTVTGRNSSFTVPQEVWQENWAKIRQKLADGRGKKTSSTS